MRSDTLDASFSTDPWWKNGGRSLSTIVGGWNISSIIILQSGGLFTVTMQTTTTEAFSAGALRANRIGEPNLPASERTVQCWFDTGAFEAPPHQKTEAAKRRVFASKEYPNPNRHHTTAPCPQALRQLSERPHKPETVVCGGLQFQIFAPAYAGALLG